MPMTDYDNAWHVREQTTFRVLICAIAAVAISIVAAIVVGKVSGDLVTVETGQTFPVNRIEVRGDQPQRYEFVTQDGRVVASIVVRP